MKQLFQMKTRLVFLLIILGSSYLSFSQTTEETQGYKDFLEQLKITKETNNANQLLGMIRYNIDLFPNGYYIDKIRKKGDNHFYNYAVTTHNYALLTDYLKYLPEGKNKDKIAKSQEEIAIYNYNIAKSKNTVDAYTEFVNEHLGATAYINKAKDAVEKLLYDPILSINHTDPYYKGLSSKGSLSLEKIQKESKLTKRDINLRLEYLSKSLKLSKTDEVINGWWKILLEKNTISLYKTLAVSNPFNTYKNEYIQSSLLDSLKKQALINIDIIEYNVALNDVSIPTLEDFVENKTENMYWDEVDLELKRLLQADKNAFKQAKNTHSREAYLNYIQKNPYGKYVNEAKNLRDGISVISNIVGIRSSFNGKPTIRIYFDVKLDNEETTRVKINKIYNSQGIPMRKVNWADRYKVFQPIKKSGNYFITWFVLEDTDVLEGEITFKLDATVKEIFQAGTFTHEKTGKEYRTVEIGEDVWMAEDLNAVQNWGNTKDYYHSSDNKGRLYNLSAARTVAIEIPGWHLPTEEEWERLDKFFDKNSNNVERDLYRYFISNHVGCYTKTKFKAVNEGYGVRHKTGYYLESAEASFREVDETSYFWLDYDEYRVEKDEAGIKRGKVGYIRKHKSIISDTRNATSNCYSVRLVKDK